MAEIYFDPEKDLQNQQKHGLSLREAIRLDWLRAEIVEDVRQDYTERRFIAYAPLKHRLHVFVFTPREGGIRAISLRKANRREQEKYEKKQEK